MKTLPTLLLTCLLAGLFLAACGVAPALLPSATSIPTEAPTLPATVALEPTATTPASETPAFPLDCTDGINLDEGIYRAENNTWGKGDLTGWSQCIGLQTTADGSLTARWTWDWPQAGGNIKAYPEIIYGQKPGGPSTTPDLPRQIKDLSEVAITYDIVSTTTGSGNLAFDVWLTDSADPTTFGVPPITHEIMIWLDRYGSLGPGGRWTENVELDGVKYSVYLAENWGSGWMYVAFNRVEPNLTGEINLVSFLEYMKEKGYVTADTYVADIELGNEIAGGTGDTILRNFRVTVK